MAVLKGLPKSLRRSRWGAKLAWFYQRSDQAVKAGIAQVFDRYFGFSVPENSSYIIFI